MRSDKVQGRRTLSGVTETSSKSELDTNSGDSESEVYSSIKAEPMSLVRARSVEVTDFWRVSLEAAELLDIANKVSPLVEMKLEKFIAKSDSLPMLRTDREAARFVAASEVPPTDTRRSSSSSQSSPISSFRRCYVTPAAHVWRTKLSLLIGWWARVAET